MSGPERRARAASPAPAKGGEAKQLSAVERTNASSETLESKGKPATAKAVGATSLVAGRGAAAGNEAYAIAGWVALLCFTQLAMFIYAKRAMQKAKLPSLLCLVQFVLAAFGATVPSPLTGAGWPGLKLMKRDHCKFLLPLGILWTAGFLLLNASVALMSAAVANAVRSMEPVCMVLLGFALFGERYSLMLLVTLLPICAGAVLASQKGNGGGSALSLSGVLFAALSNFGFASRPFLAQRLAAQGAALKLDSSSIFFNAMCIGVVVLGFSTALLEGNALAEAWTHLRASGTLGDFVLDVTLSGAGFFVYQFSQMVLMTRMSTIAFSIVTPMSKAFIIVSCAIYFAEGLSLLNMAGVAISTAGVLLFSAVRRHEASAVSVAVVAGKSKTS